MIKITKLNGKSFTINAFFIETVESFPDTTITLSNGRKYVVQEPEDRISELIKEFYKDVGLVGRRMLGEHDDEE